MTDQMSDEELYEKITGEPVPAYLKRQAGPVNDEPTTEPGESIEVDGIKIPAWLAGIKTAIL